MYSIRCIRKRTKRKLRCGDKMENRIKEIREEEGIKQYALAKMTGLSEGYICHLEKGTRDSPSYKVMVKIAVALKRQVQEVFIINQSI